MKTRTIPESRPTPLCSITVQYACPRRGLPSRGQFKRWVVAALQGRREGAELCIRLVGEAEGRALNARYRDKDHPTNVLSFPAEVPVHPELLGDLVLCAPVVAAEAVAQGKSLESHYAHLVVHGVLHLLGYDHERLQQAEAMEALERRILARLGFSDPYRADTLQTGQATKEVD